MEAGVGRNTKFEIRNPKLEIRNSSFVLRVPPNWLSPSRFLILVLAVPIPTSPMPTEGEQPCTTSIRPFPIVAIFSRPAVLPPRRWRQARLPWDLARAEESKTRKLLFFTKSSGFQHSVITRPKSGGLAYAEKILIDLGKKHGYEVTATKDGRYFAPKSSRSSTRWSSTPPATSRRWAPTASRRCRKTACKRSSNSSKAARAFWACTAPPTRSTAMAT